MPGTLDNQLATQLAAWPVGSAGVVVGSRQGIIGAAGDVTREFRWASVTKLLTALTVLQADEDGLLSLDEAVGPPGSTVRHLLAHASGLAVDSDKVIAAPGRRRIYSNRGFELVAGHVERRVGRPFADLLDEVVLTPLGMSSTRLEDSPAHGAAGPVSDLGRLAQELLEPRILTRGVMTAVTTTAFPGLAGVLPGFGRQEPNDWALGFEIRARKQTHWTSEFNAPSTFGHFGQSGSFLWVDPEAGVTCVVAGDTAFGPWAAQLWPRLSTLVLHHFGSV